MIRFIFIAVWLMRATFGATVGTNVLSDEKTS